MRLIDGDALANWIDGSQRLDTEHDYEEVARYIEECPTVDAVPVCRCKDCRHGHTAEDKYGEYLYCDISGEDNYDPDFYCANGERKGRNE